METCNVFFSWQSDIKESKNFISDCLRQLPKKLKDIAIIEVDRDTRGLAGAPDIGDARNHIICSISAAICILRECGVLHGGKPEILSAQYDLSKLLLEGMGRI